MAAKSRKHGGIDYDDPLAAWYSPEQRVALRKFLRELGASEEKVRWAIRYLRSRGTGAYLDHLLLRQVERGCVAPDREAEAIEKAMAAPLPSLRHSTLRHSLEYVIAVRALRKARRIAAALRLRAEQSRGGNGRGGRPRLVVERELVQACAVVFEVVTGKRPTAIKGRDGRRRGLFRSLVAEAMPWVGPGKRHDPSDFLIEETVKRRLRGLPPDSPWTKEPENPSREPPR